MLTPFATSSTTRSTKSSRNASARPGACREGGANVPVFVLEYLLGKYCASSDPGAIELGLTVVRDTLANNYIRPDEATKAQSKVKQKGATPLSTK